MLCGSVSTMACSETESIPLKVGVGAEVDS